MSRGITRLSDRKGGKSFAVRPGIVVILFGIILFILGIVIIVYQPLVSKAKQEILEEVSLTPGKMGLTVWSTPYVLPFRLYAFHVTNPEGVMQGEIPKFVEHGPYIYDEKVEKNILRHDEELDEIEYTITRTYHFNQKKSGNCTENDQVTILNPAYMGTMNTLAGLPPSFLKKYGDDIPKLFPDPKSIFVKGKIKDIFFSGVPLMCDPEKYEELTLICNTLKMKHPPLMWPTDEEGVYLYSFFHKVNGTPLGPYTVNRGMKDFTRLGDITSYNRKRVLRLWRNKTCNIVKGTDTITWAPMVERLPRVFTFIEDLCRSMFVDYKDDVVVNGLLGWRFVLPSSLWDEENINCYCPVVKKQANCLPRGLLDLTKCQEGPVIASEPHFLHADPELLNYATGLNPNEEDHCTYIIIDPLTGAPLNGRKKIQLNMHLNKLPVVLLENVSEGYFPMMWCEDGDMPEKILLASTYQLHRLMNVFSFLQCIPLIIGVFLIFVGLILYGNPRHTRKRIVIPATDSIPIPSDRNFGNIVRRSQPRPRRVFE